MAGATRERQVACDLLREQRVRSARARDLLRSSDALSGLPERERGFVTSLVLGVVRTSGTLDALLDAHLRRGGHLEPRVRDALRAAAYELVYLSTPPRVAVSQGVELVRRANPRAAGLANAVLRRVAEDDVPRVVAATERVAAGGCDEADLALAAGLPGWLVGQLHGSLGDADLNWFVRLQSESPRVYAAGNLARNDAASTERLLSDAGIPAQPTGLPASFVLGGGGGLARSGLVASCDVVPADLGAQAATLVASPTPDSHVLEVGQGRGTKSILLENAALGAGGSADVVALDSEGFKVELSRRRMERAGLAGHVCCVSYDARRLAAPDVPDALRGPFDLVFVDAPCSGTGTMRRHPETPWSLSEKSVSPGGALPRLQLQILTAAASRVAPGGTLAYSTCSVLRSEDEDVVSAFLASDAGRDFSVEPVVAAPVGAVTPEGFLRTLAPGLDCDVHFCARLVHEG